MTPENKIKIDDTIATSLGLSADKITPESKLSSDLGCDSLDVLEIIMAIEEEFHIEISDDEMADTDETYTVQQLYDLVSVKLDGLQ